jgi:hypothetical protein
MAFNDSLDLTETEFERKEGYCCPRNASIFVILSDINPVVGFHSK